MLTFANQLFDARHFIMNQRIGQTQIFNLMMVLEEESGNHQSLSSHYWS